MDFIIRSFTKKNDQSTDKVDDTVMDEKHSWPAVNFDYDNADIPINKGPSLTVDCYDKSFDLSNFLIQWNLKYNNSSYTNELLLSHLKLINDFRLLINSLPIVESVTVPTKQPKWYKMCSYEPVNELTIEEIYWCNDITLFRYLRSYNFKLEKAFNMIRKTLSWRRFRNPSNIKPEFIKPALTKGMIYRRGYDKIGAALVYFRPSDEAPIQLEIQVLSIFYTLERALQTLRLMEGNDKVFVILDLNGWSLSKMPTMDLVIETVRVLSDHYTDVLHEVLLVDAPMFMDTIINMVRCAIDKSTSNKIKCKNRGDKLYEYLKSKIPLRFLEDSLGGECKDKFNIDDYWDEDALQYDEYHHRREIWYNTHRAEFEVGRGGGGIEDVEETSMETSNN